MAFGAVEQRGRAAHHFDALGRRRIDGDPVVARLARQVADALAVLERSARGRRRGHG